MDFFPPSEGNKSCTAVTTTDWGKPTGFLLVELALMNRNNFFFYNKIKWQRLGKVNKIAEPPVRPISLDKRTKATCLLK